MIQKNLLKRIMGLFLVLPFSIIGAKAQTNIASYKFTKATGATYTSITGTTLFSAAYDNTVSAAIPLGGTFTYGGTAFTTCYISTNGFLSFGAAFSGSDYTPMSTAGTGVLGAISAFGQDAGGSTVAGSTPLISYTNVGSEFVVQYQDHANYFNRSTERLNFQIRLDLTTNDINIVYGSCTNPGIVSTSGTSVQVGIRGNSTVWATNVNNLTAQNVPTGTTCSWDDAVTGSANSSSMLFSGTTNVAVKINSGLSYTWTPSTAVAPVRVFGAVTGLSTTGATISWTASTGATQYNVQYRTSSSCSWTNFSGNPVAATTATLTGLTSDIYQVRVQAADGTNSSIWSHIPNQAGTGDGYTATGTFSTVGMTYVSSTTAQPTTTTVSAGSQDVGILRVAVVVIGNLSPLSLTKLDLSTNGSTNAADIANAKVYYTGTSTTLTTTAPFGTVVVSPSGAYSVTGSQLLTGGASNTTNYFWVAYDVNCTAVVGDSLDAECSTITLDAAPYTPTITAPPFSKRAISALYGTTRTDGNGTTAISPGSLNNTVVYGNVTGSALCPANVTSVTFTVSGTSPATDITQAKAYYTTTSAFSLATATLFGTAVPSPSAGAITFTGSQALASGSGNYFWLVYDISCTAVAANTVNGDITSITVGASVVAPTGTVPGANAIAATSTSNTVADGDWSNPATWACGIIPSSATAAVSINNVVTVSTATPLAGNVTIAAAGTLNIVTGGTLTMGASSAGGATGNSNKLLTNGGALNITGGILNVNGGISSTGNLTMSSGTINLDPNDGTNTGSFSNTNGGFYIAQGANALNITGGNINFLDPLYTASAGTGQAVIGYSHASIDGIIGTGCIVTFGGGDDVNPLNVNGFYIESNLSTGTLEIGSVIVAGGRYSAQREVTSRQGVTNYISKVKNLTINAGCELVLTAGSAPFAITGDLVNNGVITNAAAATGSGLFFADVQYSGGVLLFPTTTPQTISGSGFFKKSTADADPTAQTGNVIGGMSVYQTSASGLTLNMPITATNFLRLLKGKVNTTAANFLALGNGTSLPGNAASLTAGTGTVYGFATTTYATAAAFDGGWVNGPFNRWVTAATTTGQQGLMPVGSDTGRTAQILFTAAPTTAGYLTASWTDGAGVVALTTPLNEPAVVPATIDKRTAAFWTVTNGGTLTGGTYTASFNNKLASGVSDFANTTLIKRANSGVDWAIEGTHVASTGSNSSPNVSRTGLTTFSDFSIGAGGLALPITIQYFTGTKQGAANNLNWKVNCYSTPSVTLVLERGTDGRNFSQVHSITATALRCDMPFAYNDAQPLAGMNYYRLKMIDADGKISYSSIVALLNKDKGLEIVSIYPNPVVSNGSLTLNVTSAQASKLDLVIVDMQGRIVVQKSLAVANGFNSIPVNVSQLSSGSYQVYGTSTEGKTKVLGFVKQ